MSSNHNPLPPEDMEDCLGFDTYEDVIEFLISVTGDPDVKLKVSYAQDDDDEEIS